jgi:hypothetical protein
MMNYPAATAATSAPDALVLSRPVQPPHCSHCGGVAFYDPLDRFWFCLLCSRTVRVTVRRVQRECASEAQLVGGLNR